MSGKNKSYPRYKQKTVKYRVLKKILISTQEINIFYTSLSYLLGLMMEKYWSTNLKDE